MFKQRMEAFNQNSVKGLRDWTKMQFMGGGVHEFIDTIAGYKPTTSVRLGIDTMLVAIQCLSWTRVTSFNKAHLQSLAPKPSRDGELAQDTAYNLGVHLQRIDDRLAQSTSDNACNSGIRVDMEDERKATIQCLRIYEDVKSRVQSLINQGLSQMSQNTAEEVCKMTSEVPSQKVYSIGEVSASGGSDQEIVATIEGSFSIEKAKSCVNSAQLLGAMIDETLKHRVKDHYV